MTMNGKKLELKDDDYEEERSGPEDDAPESFQSLSGNSSQWTAVPDLVRVEKSSFNNTEDDSPEGISFLSRDRSSLNQSNLNHHPDTSLSYIEDSFLRETGAIPKTSRLLAPPDISQTGFINAPHSLNVSKLNKSNDPSTIYLANKPMSGNIRLNSTSRIKIDGPIDNLNLQKISSQPKIKDNDRQFFENTESSNFENFPLTTLLPTSFNSSHLPTCSSSTSESCSTFRNNSTQNEANFISNALKNIQISIENLSKQLNERITHLEEKINDMIKDFSYSQGAQISRTHSNQSSIDQCQKLFEHQKKQLEEEKKNFLLIFSNALKQTATSMYESFPKSNCDINKPK